MAERPPSIGIAVVHGVGDPKPGETLDTLVETLCGRNPSLRIEAFGRCVLTESWEKKEIEVQQRRLVHTRSGATIFVSEVFWGDVARVSEGWWGIVKAVSALAMGLHALIFAGGGVTGDSRLPRPHLPCFTTESTSFRAAFWTAFVGAYHIKGVLISLAVGVLLFVALSLAWRAGTPPPDVSLVVLPVFGWLAFRVPWIVPTVAAGIWCVVGYIVPICGILLATSHFQGSDGWIVGLVFTVLFSLCHTLVILFTKRCCWGRGILRRTKMVACWAATVPWIWLTVLLLPRDGASHVMRDLGSLLVSAYHLALGMAALWVFATGALCSLSAITADTEQRARGKVIFLGYAFEFSLWVAIATALGSLVGQLPGHERLAWLGLKEAYGSGTWFQVAPVAFLFSLGLGVKTFMWLWNWKRKEATPAIADLVGSWPLPVAAIITALVCGAAVLTALEVWPPELNPPLWLVSAVTVLLSLLIFAARSLQEPIRHGLDLACDVTLYFRGRSWASDRKHRSDEILKARFTAVADALLTAVGDDRLVVVAHSQGTVIAADALRGWSNTPKVDLLTMGSPLRSLDATFFPKGFGDIVEAVGSKAKSWVNLYREDDYVGRQLGGVTDKKIDGSGHEGYWTDPSVLSELEGLIKL
jgi:hypothetical protein